MKKRLYLGGLVKISGVSPKIEIGNQQGLRQYGCTGIFEVRRKEHEPAGDDDRKYNQDQWGQNATSSPFPELENTKMADIDVREDETSDEKSRNHEKDVHPDIPPGTTGVGMKEKDGQNCHGPKAVNVGLVFHGYRRSLPM
jgi:hypothetical protein